MTEPENLESVTEVLERLGVAGLDHSFVLTDDGQVRDTTTDERYEPEVVEILSTHRNEGDTDPGDESLLMLLRAPDGAEGFMVTQYGANAPHPDALRRLGTGG